MGDRIRNRLGLAALALASLLAGCATTPEPLVESFPDLRPPSVPPNYLACPPGYCKGRVDRETATLPLGAEALAAVVRRTIEAKPRTVFIKSAQNGLEQQYQQHSATLDFTDTVTVAIIPRSPTQSAVAIYSQSGMGLYDFGVNEHRVDDWLASIETAARAAPRP
jgi:Protein of unknown function (DUF1499)